MQKCRRGQSLVEFALVLPLLVVFLALFVDVGRFIHVQLMLEQIASDAARYASVKDPSTGTTPTSSDVSARVAGRYPTAFQPYTCTVNVSTTVGADAAATCELSTTVRPFLLNAVGFRPQGFMLSAAATQPKR
jgi:Flp pilus assembly protein TadG